MRKSTYSSQKPTRNNRTRFIPRPGTCVLLLLGPIGSLLGYQFGLMSACSSMEASIDLEREQIEVPDVQTQRIALADKDATNVTKSSHVLPACSGRRPHTADTRAWVFQNTETVRYTHMPMVEKLPNGSLFAVWQASDLMEGTMAQHIEYSINRDGKGTEWSPPTRLPLKFRPGSNASAAWEERGGQWGAVLHNDGLGRLWLFFSETRDQCIRPHVGDWYPQRYIIGGDLKATRLDLSTGQWSRPALVYSQDEDGLIPKVTANKLIVLSTGEWVLPFWREKAGQVCKSANRGTKTTSGVLISKDQGNTWTSHGSLQHSKSWLIENTLVEARNGDLIMFFRTTLGFVFQSRSSDKGHTWGSFDPTVLPNPDSKVHALQRNNGDVLIAFNDHPKFLGGVWTKVHTHSPKS
eukprot:9469937-Pyramimonas_sp.AAC.2